jgi:ubiquitin carboxyl-terminal hydrolase 34
LNTFSQYLVAACALRLNGAYRTSQLIIAQQSTAVQTLQQLRTGEFEEPSEFKELLKKLKDGLGDSIIKMFSLETFVPVLRSLIDELLSSTRDLEPEDRSVIEYALVTIVTVLLYDQRLATSSVGDDEFLRVLFDGLYTEKSSNVRSLFSRAILLFCHQSHSMNRQILPSKVILERLTVNIRDDP